MMKEEDPGDPPKGLQDHWEARSHEILETPEPIHPGEESPTASDSDPWDDPKAFLASFERVAKACQWPREEWVAQLLPALSGIAEEAFETLKPADREDYEKVKATIMDAHAMKMQMQFGYFSSQEAEDPRTFHCQLQELWHRWLKPERRSKEQILEQFLASLPLHLQNWIRAEGQDTCSQAVALAEDFLVSQQIAQRRKWQRPIKEECLDSLEGEEEDLSNAGRTQAYKAAEQSSDFLGKGSRVKTENTQWGKNETEDIPRTSLQISQRNVRERTERCEEGGESVEEEEKQSVTRGDGSLQPSKVESKGETLWFSKHSRSYHCTLQLDVFDSQEDHDECANPEEDVRVNSYPKKQQRTVKGKSKSEFSENGAGVNQIRQTEEKSPSSSERGKRLSSTESLQRNEGVGSGEGLFECPHCRKCFSEKEHLANHEQLHIGKKIPEGPMSGKVFPLRQTIMRLPGINTGEKTDKCSQCGKWFCGRENLKRHQRIHTGERRYKCPDCGKSCSQSGHLKLHQRVHTGEKPYKCAWCGKDFADGGNLRKHERIHTGEKPYKCSWCGRCFTDGGTLKQHERIHTGEKPYKCSQCGKCFSERGTLKQHHRIHTGEKPYECPDCDKKFRKKGDLLRHQRVHTQEK
uniref:Zinc finger protein 436-like n=1 Tax=Pogona vitticeps TaxID=103695 RepID=A0A6J0VAZ4_9SAUR